MFWIGDMQINQYLISWGHEYDTQRFLKSMETDYAWMLYLQNYIYTKASLELAQFP